MLRRFLSKSIKNVINTASNVKVPTTTIQNLRKSNNVREFSSANPNRSNRYAWYIAGGCVTTGLMFYASKATKDQSRSNISTKNKIQFSDLQIKMAAIWWAQWLPGNRKVSFKEINQNAHLIDENHIFETMHLMQQEHLNKIGITEEQFKKFIEILSNKIRMLNSDSYSSIRFVKIGDISDYHPPQVVLDSLKEAGINHIAGLGTFPYKTEMKIYENGHIQIGDEVICTNHAVTHYGSDTDFDSAEFMKITGDKFKLIEIPIPQNDGKLLQHYVKHPDRFVLNNARDYDLPITKIYIAIHLKDFKGSESDFLKISFEDWIEILKDKEKLNFYLKENAYLYYENNKSDCLYKNSYGHIGEVSKEQIGENYYQHSTGPVRIISASSEGTVGKYELKKVMVNDFLIKRNGSKSISYLPANSTLFQVRLCDAHGNILSDQVVEPGIPLPNTNDGDKSKARPGIR